MIYSMSTYFVKMVFLLVTLYVLSACAFNRTFHRPTQNPPFEELPYYVFDKDTIQIEYDQISKEIVLKDSRSIVINHN